MRDTAQIMVSEHSMNETILAPTGDPVGLTVSIAPWPLTGPVDYTATPNVRCRVDAATQSLVMWIDVPPDEMGGLARLRLLMETALPLVRDQGATLHLPHAGLALDGDKLATALAGWTDVAVPVHSLVAFDFAARGDPPGTKSVGLAALVGQEVVAWPPDEPMRLVCARMVVRLAHDMLLNGPIMSERAFSAPETPRGSVTLVPREVPDPVVQIRF